MRKPTCGREKTLPDFPIAADMWPILYEAAEYRYFHSSTLLQ